MRVAIAGGHGKIALRLARLLSGRGDDVRSLIRKPEHAEDVRAAGAEPVVCDLEQAGQEEVAEAVGPADAVVFAAGAGPGSGPERKWTVDYGAAVKLIEAATELGVARYVMVSSMGVDDIEHASEGMRPYLQAKRDADEALMASGLDWTIVRPGRLTDTPGTGRIDAARALGRRGEITREDTALSVLEALQAPNTIRVAFEVLEGATPVREALAAL
jgi:nucleoside-diphosphate-sugar epimerase